MPPSTKRFSSHLSGKQTLRYRNPRAASSGTQFHKIVEMWTQRLSLPPNTLIEHKIRLSKLAGWMKGRGMSPWKSEVKVGKGRTTGILDLLVRKTLNPSQIELVEIKTGYKNLRKGRDSHSVRQRKVHESQVARGSILWNRANPLQKVKTAWIYYVDAHGAEEVSSAVWERYEARC